MESRAGFFSWLTYDLMHINGKRQGSTPSSTQPPFRKDNPGGFGGPFFCRPLKWGENSYVEGCRHTLEKKTKNSIYIILYLDIVK